MVVFDTSVLVSALTLPGGRGARAVAWIVNGDRAMLALGSYECVRIVSLSEYLQSDES